jgi:hypothetical protein
VIYRRDPGSAPVREMGACRHETGHDVPPSRFRTGAEPGSLRKVIHGVCPRGLPVKSERLLSVTTQETRWRTAGPYLPTLASKAALVEETRLFLVTYDQYHDLDATIQALLHNVLIQRSRSTRNIIVNIIKSRLIRWNPPDWVLQDLISFAHEPGLDALHAALLLHIPRQDHLPYDFVQQVIVPHKERGEMRVLLSEVQTFFDASQEAHPEISRWSFETRLRLSRGVLATLRDCGLLKGEINKYLGLPVIPNHVVHHLIRLLRAENIPEAQLAVHPDWQLWLWSPAQAKLAIDAFLKQEQVV